MTPLMVAVKQNNSREQNYKQMVQCLLDKGADVNWQAEKV